MKNTIKIVQLIFLLLGFAALQSQNAVVSSGGDFTGAGGTANYSVGQVFYNITNSIDGITVQSGVQQTFENSIQINLKGFLQGPYNTNIGLMTDELRNNGLIPSQSPYTDVLTIDPSVLNVTGADAIIDWIWIELRDKADGTSVVESRSALLQSDGDIVDVDGVSFLLFNIPKDDYYIMISHRNHLGVITNNTVSLYGGVTSLDLTLDSNTVSGGINAIKAMVDGSFALYAGDYNGDGQIQNTDKNSVEPLRGLGGSYMNADIDLNGEVQNSDINSVLNPNIGKGEQFSSRMMFAKRKEN
jgi:hypothetical protein